MCCVATASAQGLLPVCEQVRWTDSGRGWISSWTPCGRVTCRKDATVIDCGGFIASEWCSRSVQNWSVGVSDPLDRSHCRRRVVSALWALVPRCELQLPSLQELKSAGPGYLMGTTNPAPFTLGRSLPGKAALAAGGSKGMCVHGSKLPPVPSHPSFLAASAHPWDVVVLWCHLPNVIQTEELLGGSNSSTWRQQLLTEHSLGLNMHSTGSWYARWWSINSAKQNTTLSPPAIHFQEGLCACMGNSGRSAVCVGYLRAWALCSQSYFHVIFKGKGCVSCGLLLFF